MPKGKITTVRKARLDHGWTLQQLADASGLNWSHVQAIESRRIKGSLEAQTSLASALGVPLRLLFPETVADVQSIIRKLQEAEAKTGGKAKTGENAKT